MLRVRVHMRVRVLACTVVRVRVRVLVLATVSLWPGPPGGPGVTRDSSLRPGQTPSCSSESLSLGGVLASASASASASAH